MTFVRTGTRYLKDIRDERAVFYHGIRVSDVPKHPALRGSARTIASLIDLHATDVHGELTRRAGPGKARFATVYAIAHDSDDVRAKGTYFRALARATGGMMARSPEFLATLLTSWRAASEAFGAHDERYARNVVAYYELSRDRHLCHTHAISDPPPDRFLDLQGDKALALRKVGETSQGIVVRGIKMLATLAPIADELLVYPFRTLQAHESPQALAFAIPVAARGLRLVCRAGIARGTNAFERPLAERFDEMDALCIFDDVVIPHERVFIDGDVRFANSLRAETGMIAYLWHQTAWRVAVKAEMVLGVASLAARLSGRSSQASVQEMLGELASNAEVLRSLVIAAEAEAVRDRFGNQVPNVGPLGASGAVAAQLYARSIELLQLIGASGLVMHPSEHDMLRNADILRYFSAGDGDARKHVEVLKFASDLTIGAFGGRQLLYERFYLGAPRAVQARLYQTSERVALAEQLVESLLVPPSEDDAAETCQGDDEPRL